MISRELQEFLESGVSILVGTRDRLLVPEAIRGFGLRVEADGRELAVVVPRAWGERTLANLRDNGRLAVAVARPADHRSVQVKGSFVEVRACEESDRAALERYRELLVRDFGEIGFPPRILHRLNVWPADAVRMKVEALFEQTPGPRAGVPIVDGGRSR